MWQPMLPTRVDQVKENTDWIYEIKYDGFRCGLEWTETEIHLWSRNNHNLTKQFPEIISWCQQNQKYIKELLPLFLDGELVILRTAYHSVFSQVQQRSRMKNMKKIKMISEDRPATYIGFDVINYKGKSVKSKPLTERKQLLHNIFRTFPSASNLLAQRVAEIRYFDSLKEIEQVIFLHQSEGMVAKRKQSNYMPGKRTDVWLKVKNYRNIQGVIVGWDAENDYFHTAVFENQQCTALGKVKNGIGTKDQKTLTTFIRQKGSKQGSSKWKIDPSICVEINCLDANNQEIREPNFGKFRFDLDPEECTDKRVRLQLAQIPEKLELTKPEKLLFSNHTKQDLIIYFRHVAPFLLPRLKDKHLTVIRYPDGIIEESFYQKHPSRHEPDFIETDGKYILCNNLESLLWFANHGAIEYHIPFHKKDTDYPDELVFDLDPPSLDEFPLAVLAAKLIRELLTYKGFESFVKTSGKTGLQVHAPLDEPMNFEQTREFMHAIAHVLVTKYPDSFTTERMIKNRGKRLYLDYVQHAPKKTIIAPYSTRATKGATVATPLFWEELNDELDPRIFTIDTIPQRLNEKGCPFLIGGCTNTE
ncbi:bifunctional non-homologous end joining protein LigD [Gracilibacillus ureilyticus]|uniref:DNA ligase (ATP) n=1 Tax=Gracilibacillus ureilyticus TaxID=531814 RepID=A0A1H9M5P5_9BACI|nr:DNA ligase D [Gracilibacillus ureilyticus]SER19006.1 bifunctional non-homologous end joining protein LigD [Gracilibacillus ureilyticus]